MYRSCVSREFDARVKSPAAVPCGHLCACGPCSEQMQECPYCREPVMMWMVPAPASGLVVRCTSIYKNRSCRTPTRRMTGSTHCAGMGFAFGLVWGAICSRQGIKETRSQKRETAGDKVRVCRHGRQASWRLWRALTCQKTPRSARDVTEAARLGAARAAGRRRHQARGRRAPPNRHGRRSREPFL